MRGSLIAQALLAALFLLLPLHGVSQTAPDAFEQAVSAAVQAQSSGDFKTAIAAYRDALALRPHEAEIWANLGLMQQQTGDRPNATASFRRAHQLGPRLFVPVFFLGLESLNTGNRTEAITYFTAAQKLKPDDPNVPMYLGQAYFEQKRYDEASASYSRAIKLNPASGEAWYRLGITHLKSAEADSGRLAQTGRRSSYFHALAADSLGSQNKLDHAAKAYRLALATPNPPPCTRSSLGFVLLRQNQLATAESEFQQDLNAGGCLQARLGMIRLAFEKSPSTASLTPLGALWRLDPSFIESHGSLLSDGLTPDKFSALDNAFDATRFPDLSPQDIELLRASLHSVQSQANIGERVQPNPTAATDASADDEFGSGQYQLCTAHLRPSLATLSRRELSLLAACSFFTGDYQATLDTAKALSRTASEDEGLYWAIRANQRLAVRCLLRAGKVSPNSLRLHELLAESYRDMGSYPAAEAEYAIALGINPNDFTALLGAAANYLQEYRIDLAAVMIARALQQHPDDPEANYIMGEILIDQHHFDQAEPYLARSLSAKAELIPRIHALFGQIYASRGDNLRAIKELNLGAPSDDDGSVHFLLGKLYQKTGQPGLAAAAFAITRQIQSKQNTD